MLHLIRGVYSDCTKGSSLTTLKDDKFIPSWKFYMVIKRLKINNNFNAL